jgi:hypothetical protein
MRPTTSVCSTIGEETKCAVSVNVVISRRPATRETGEIMATLVLLATEQKRADLKSVLETRLDETTASKRLETFDRYNTV